MYLKACPQSGLPIRPKVVTDGRDLQSGHRLLTIAPGQTRTFSGFGAEITDLGAVRASGTPADITRGVWGCLGAFGDVSDDYSNFPYFFDDIFTYPPTFA
mgnify:CR=1 FL=1